MKIISLDIIKLSAFITTKIIGKEALSHKLIDIPRGITCWASLPLYTRGTFIHDISYKLMKIFIQIKLIISHIWVFFFKKIYLFFKNIIYIFEIICIGNLFSYNLYKNIMYKFKWKDIPGNNSSYLQDQQISGLYV